MPGVTSTTPRPADPNCMPTRSSGAGLRWASTSCTARRRPTFPASSTATATTSSNEGAGSTCSRGWRCAKRYADVPPRRQRSRSGTASRGSGLCGLLGGGWSGCTTSTVRCGPRRFHARSMRRAARSKPVSRRCCTDAATSPRCRSRRPTTSRHWGSIGPTSPSSRPGCTNVSFPTPPNAAHIPTSWWSGAWRR